jgi:uncharacterized metal-binding protein YceD (DUF177 family)
MHSSGVNSDLAVKIQHTGLKNDVHLFDFQLNGEFFANFEHSIIKQCDIKISIVFDKRIEPYHTKIQIDGTVQTECDRCNALFPLKIMADYELYIKYTGEHSDGDDSETEIIFITRDEPEIDFTKLIYDLLHLNIPIYKTCDDAGSGAVCDEEMLKTINQYLQKPEKETNKEIDPRWEKLKKLKDNLN